MSRIHPMPGVRLGIRIDGRTLTVPAMHPHTPPAIRVQVFELVLRRLWGEALELALATNEAIEERTSDRQRIAALMSQTPHRSARGATAA